jgi:hypothetical protein
MLSGTHGHRTPTASGKTTVLITVDATCLVNVRRQRPPVLNLPAELRESNIPLYGSRVRIEGI